MTTVFMLHVATLLSDQSNRSNQECGLPAAQVPRGGYATTENTTIGIKVTYTCEKGFQLVGESTRHCQLNGTWSGNLPLCVGSTTQGSLNIRILSTATVVSLLSVAMTAVMVTLLLYAGHLVHRWRLVTKRKKRNQNLNSVINNPIYDGEG